MTKNHMSLILRDYAKNVPHKNITIEFKPRNSYGWVVAYYPRPSGEIIAVVSVPSLKTRHDFLSCLHELGHVYQGHFRINFDTLTSNEVYKHEYDAWDWALKELPKHTDIRPEDYEFALSQLNTYNLELQLGQRRRFSTAR